MRTELWHATLFGLHPFGLCRQARSTVQQRQAQQLCIRARGGNKSCATKTKNYIMRSNGRRALVETYYPPQKVRLCRKLLSEAFH